MTRVKPIEKTQASEEVINLYEKMEGKGVHILNFYKTLAHSPGVISSALKLGNDLLNKAELSPKLRELVILRVAALAQSEYEWAQHVPIALQTGAKQSQIDDIHKWMRSDQFTEEEKTVLQYTDEVALRIKVADDTFDALRKYFSERQIVELTLSIGYWGMVARVLVPLQVELDEQTVGSVDDLLGNRKTT